MVVFDKPHALTDVPLHYCPGCTHGIVHRLVAEVIDELGIEGRTIGIAPVGCSVMAYDYFNCDMIEAAHGRAPAVATGVKRADKENIVFTYQGDGDLASIGMAETVHSAARNENITVIFINNAIRIITFHIFCFIVFIQLSVYCTIFDIYINNSWRIHWYNNQYIINYISI